jgi:hypothetical protein
MPTASEDVKFIYLVLTDNGQPTVCSILLFCFAPLLTLS